MSSINELEENIKHELSKEYNYLKACNHLIEKDNEYLVYSEKTKHITDCKDFLENLNSLRKYQKILSQELISHIDHIIFEIGTQLKKIEEHYKLILEKIIRQNLEDRINNIQKLLKKFTKTGTINGRLLINHFIILTNVFDGFAPRLMHYMIDKQFHPQLNSLLFVFSYNKDKEIILNDR